MNHRNRFLVLLALLPTLALAQFVWQDNGVAIRQGAHLGWNGAAVSAGDDVALFYYDCLRDGTRDVWGTRIAPNGTHVWGQNGKLVAGDISEQRAPVVAAYPDGSVLAVWEDYSVGRFRDLKAQRYSANGYAMWSPEEGVTVVAQVRDQFDVKLALNENDYAFVVFTDDRLTDGPDTRLNSFAQILTPDGDRVGPLDGIQLLHRHDFYNQPVSVVCQGSDAYILNKMPADSQELVIQKLSQAGALGFPNDEGIAEYYDFGQHSMVAIENGLAVSWTVQDSSVFYGDAKLTLLDTNREPLPGWPAEGISVGSGEFMQTIVKLATAPDGGVVVALANYELDPDNAELTLLHYARTGELLWGPVSFGVAALRTSPLDWVWEGDNLVVVWTGIANENEYQAHTQKLNSLGTKLWGENGNLVWSRVAKKLRTEIEKPENAAARLIIVSGRSIAQPESLFVSELNSGGQIEGEADFVRGGWTYDGFDQRAVRIGNQKLAVIWTDNRASLNRTVYFQFLDANGGQLLEHEGRQLAVEGNFSIHTPPAIAADGHGGAFMAWGGDSLGLANVMHVHRVDENGVELWETPATVRSHNGFYGQPYLIPDDNGGVFLVYNRFNDAFVARIDVAHIAANGSLSWAEGFHEFPGEAGSDVLLTSAVSDNNGGCYISGINGPWQDTQAVVFHILPDESFGEGWTGSGRTYGPVMSRERNSKLLTVGDNLLLTYEQPQSESAATYDVKGVLITPQGTDLWGSQGRRLTAADAAAVRHQLSVDGQGGFLLAYEDFRDGNHAHDFVARFSADGVAMWDGVERRVCSHSGDQNFMSMTHDGQGGVWVAWEDLRNSDIYSEIDLYGTHMNGDGEFASVNGFTWPEDGYPICDVPTYQQEPILIPWANGSALAMWRDLRSSNPGRCCGAGAVGDIFNNVYAQVLSETSLGAGDESDVLAPSSFELAAYPNPFNPSTKFDFTLPQTASVALSIYNVLGQKAGVLFDKPLTSGSYSYSWNAADFPSGIYFAKLETTTGLSTVRKLTLVK